MRSGWGVAALAALLLAGAPARAEGEPVVSEIVAGCNDARWSFEELDLAVASLAADTLAEVIGPGPVSEEAVAAALAPEHFTEGPDGDTPSLIARNLAALSEATGSIEKHAEAGEASSSAQADIPAGAVALASAEASDEPVLP